MIRQLTSFEETLIGLATNDTKKKRKKKKKKKKKTKKTLIKLV